MPARSPKSVRSSAPSPASAAAERILDTAGRHLFTYGYSAVTMDDLAAELGMSKKTLYVHFPSKDALVATLLDRFAEGVRAEADAIFGDRALTFPVRMVRFGGAVLQRLSRITPQALRDLQRNAPHLYRKLEEVRSKNIPLVFGQILREGQAAGTVRQDIDPAFAIEFWRPAIQGLLHPDSLERLRLAPHEVMRRAIDLFFRGVLTPTGRKDHEKHLDP